MKDKEIQVTRGELFMLAAEMVQENQPLTNKEFRFEDKDRCVEMLYKLVEIGHLSEDWIQSAASANVSNRHCFIDCNEKGAWHVLHGMSKTQNTREEFLEHIAKLQKKMEEGKVTVQDRYGKRFFGGKK